MAGRKPPEFLVLIRDFQHTSSTLAGCGSQSVLVTTFDGRIMVDFVIDGPMVWDDMQMQRQNCTGLVANPTVI